MTTGRNVWRHVQTDLVLPARWRRCTIESRDIDFAWGPSSGHGISELGFVEFAIVAGEGGAGTLWIADLAIEDRTPAHAPSAEASSAQPGFPAAAALEGSGWKPRRDDRRPWIAIDSTRAAHPRRTHHRLARGGPGDAAFACAPRTPAADGKLCTPRCAPAASAATSICPASRADICDSSSVSPRRARRCAFSPSNSRARSMRSGTPSPPPSRAAGIRAGCIASRASGRPIGTSNGTRMRAHEWRRHGRGERRDRSRSSRCYGSRGGSSPGPTSPRGRSLPRVGCRCPSVIWESERLAPVDSSARPRRRASCRVRYRFDNLADAPLSARLFVVVRPFQVTPPWQNFRNLGGVSRVHDLAWARRGAARQRGDLDRGCAAARRGRRDALRRRLHRCAAASGRRARRRRGARPRSVLPRARFGSIWRRRRASPASERFVACAAGARAPCGRSAVRLGGANAARAVVRQAAGSPMPSVRRSPRRPIFS